MEIVPHLHGSHSNEWGIVSLAEAALRGREEGAFPLHLAPFPPASCSLQGGTVHADCLNRNHPIFIGDNFNRMFGVAQVLR